MSSSPCFLDPIVIPLVRGKTLLDVGCGYGRWGHLLQSNYWETQDTEPMEVDGLDVFEPNLALCERGGAYRRLYHHELPEPIGEGRWDTVLACEVLEHLEQDQVEPVLADLEAHAGLRIICTAPNWPYYRGGSDTIVGFNPYDAHKAHLPRELFLDRGYQIVGAGFGNPRHPLVQVLHGMQGDWKRALEILPRLLPELAHTIVAYRDVTP